MAETIGNTESMQDLESTTVGIFRTSAVVKGGRRFSFSALVVVGDRRGRVGYGYAKAPGVPNAIEKAQKDARKNLSQITLLEGTFPHPIEANFGASSVRLIPAAPGTGVVAGGTIRAVLEMAGVRDALSKAYGSTNKINLVKATFEALKQLRTKQQVAALRGTEIVSTAIEEMLEKGRRYAPKVDVNAIPAARMQQAKTAQKGRRGGGQGRGRQQQRGGGGRRDGGQGHQPAGAAAEAKAPAAAPVAESAAPHTEQNKPA